MNIERIRTKKFISGLDHIDTVTVYIGNGAELWNYYISTFSENRKSLALTEEYFIKKIENGHTVEGDFSYNIFQKNRTSYELETVSAEEDSMGDEIIINI